MHNFEQNKKYMEKITSKLVSKMISDALKNGKSEEISVDESNMKYLRVLLSGYNMRNNTKLSAKRVNDVNVQILAPFREIMLPGVAKDVVYLLQKVLVDPEFKISFDQYRSVSNALRDLAVKCEERVVESFPSFVNRQVKNIEKSILNEQEITEINSDERMNQAEEQFLKDLDIETETPKTTTKKKSNLLG